MKDVGTGWSPITTNTSKDNDSERATDSPSKTSRPLRRDNRQIYSRPLPLTVYPLPVFLPHNPLSLLQIAYVLFRDYLYPPSSQSEAPYQGYFSARTRSVHVTDKAAIRALWEMGFFGKGSLSRSEPNWLDFERRRLGLVAFKTSEEVTARRRKERDDFKKERARIERETVEAQQQREAESQNARHDSPQSPNGNLEKHDTPGPTSGRSLRSSPGEIVAAGTKAREQMLERQKQLTQNDNIPSPSPKNQANDRASVEMLDQQEPTNQEHLQLSLEEAFFLTYSLGALELVDSRSSKCLQDPWSLLQLFRQHSFFPPVSSQNLQPDDPFLLSYVVYHHFRSLGWVIRDGIKFAVDYLLYERGPVFSHAAFAVMIIPSYSHSYWHEDPGRSKEVKRKKSKKTWHWLHCVNRVQSQVVKTLVFVYVDVPPPEEPSHDLAKDVGKLLTSYRVREFCLQRWSPNRNRG